MLALKTEDRLSTYCTRTVPLRYVIFKSSNLMSIKSTCVDSYCVVSTQTYSTYFIVPHRYCKQYSIS